MSKTNQNQLSPKQYLRTKVRDLKISACYISSDWKSSGFATCVVIREHNNGNRTHAFYQLDLLAEGIINTFYEFNILAQKYQEVINYYIKTHQLVECNYDLIHQLVYGVKAFADNFRLRAHKDFEYSRYLLMPENYKVAEDFDIVFGENSKPLVIVSANDSKAALIASLNKNIGPENFKVIRLEDLEKEQDEDHSHHHHHGENEPLFDLPFEIDPSDNFDQENIENWSDQDWEDFESGKKQVSPKITLQVIDFIYDQHFDSENASKEIDVQNIDIKQLNISREQISENHFDIDSKTEKEIGQLYLQILSKPSHESLEKLLEISAKVKNYPPIYSYISNAYIKLSDIENSERWTEMAYQQFPEYFFAKLSYAQMCLQRGQSNKIPEIFENKYSLIDILPQREKFHVLEVLNYCAIMCLYFCTRSDIDSANLYWKELKKLGEKEEELYLLAQNELMVLKAKVLKSQA